MAIVGLGAPLLAIRADVSPEFWTSRGLVSANSSCSSPSLSLEVAAMPQTEFSLGGSMLTTLALLREALGKEHSISILGSIGDDDFARILRKLCADAGIFDLFCSSNVSATGTTCTVHCEGRCAQETYRGAARHYKLDHLRFSVWENVEAAQYLYSSASYFMNCPKAVFTMAEHCAKMKKTFLFNLSASFLLSYFTKQVYEIMPFVDYVFGNKEEALLLIIKDEDGQQLDLDDVARRIAQLPTVEPSKRRVVILTDGPNPVTVARSWAGPGVKIEKYPVNAIRARPAGASHYEVVRYPHSGDAFVAGFIAGLVRHEQFENCILAATEMARAHIRKKMNLHV